MRNRESNSANATGVGAEGGSEPAPPAPGRELTIRDAFGIVWRRKWIVLLIVVAATVTAYVFSSTRTAEYEATADLIYEKQIDIANPLTGQAYRDVDRDLELRSVGSILVSPDMQRRTGDDLSEAGHEIDLADVPVETEVVIDSGASSSNLVRITTTGPDPETVAVVANAYADAFVLWRKQRVQDQIKSAAKAVRAKLAEYETDRGEAGSATDSTDRLVLQQRLRDLEILKSTATGNFRVLVPAEVPEEPVSPQPLRSALLGLGIGFFAAIGLAFLLDQFDRRLRGADDAVAILRQPVLGRIPLIPRKHLADGPLVTLTHPGDHVAEAFRALRTNLDFAGVDGDVRSIAVTSCVQGEGKSVTVANLAVSFALTGKRVIVVDGDLRRPQLHRYFGVKNAMGVSTVIAGKHGIAAVAQPVSLTVDRGDPGEAKAANLAVWGAGAARNWRLYVVTSGPAPPNPGEMVSSQRFADIIAKLEQEADIVLVDTPAMFAVGDSLAISAAVDALVFLVDVSLIKRPQLVAAADQLSSLPVRRLGVILRLPADSGGGYYGYYSAEAPSTPSMSIERVASPVPPRDPAPSPPK